MPATSIAPQPTTAAVERLLKKLRLSTPLLAVYDAAASEAFAPVFEPEEDDCCFSFYDRWIAGETLVLKKGGGGCKGAHRALGIEQAAPPHLAHFLTDGVGAPKGKGCAPRRRLRRRTSTVPNLPCQKVAASSWDRCEWISGTGFAA